MNKNFTNSRIARTLFVVFMVFILLFGAGSASSKRALVIAMKTDEMQTILSDEENTRLYFAYGSNLDEGQMAERCLAATKAGLASIVESPGDAVEGVLWMISTQDEKILDLYEGVATGHYIKEDLVVEDIASGEFIEAFVYIAVESEFGTPRIGYLEKIVRAAEKHGFTESYIKELKTWQ